MPDSENIDWPKKEKKSILLRKFLDGVPQFSPGKDFPDEVYTVVAGFWWTEWEDDADYYNIRLYTSLDLNEYVEFERGFVRHIENYDESTDENKGGKALTPVVVWLARNTPVTFARRSDDESVVRLDQFLAGDIVDSYLTSSAQELPTRTGGGRSLLRSLYQPCSWGGCGSDKTPCVT